MHRLIAWLAVPCCAALLAGCAGVGPAAGHFYPAHAASPDRVPVIVIPGLMGSRLVRASDGVEFWPGGTRKLLTSDYLDLALRIDPVTLEPLDDGLVPGGIFEGAVGQDFYGRLVHELRVAGGYQQISPGRPVVQQRARLYVFTYDWRQDNVKTVRKLDELIEQIRRDYGDPQLRVDVIAHSMGGLIVRYFERYGTVDLLDGNVFEVTGLGVSKLRRVVLLGTPNQGTVTAVHKFLNGYRVGISALPPEGVATMPGTFQLFPHPLVDWVANVNGRRLNFDVYDAEFWRRYEWSIFDHRIQRRLDRRRDILPEQEVFERWFEKRLARARGVVQLVGVCPKGSTLPVDLFDFHFKELTLTGAYGRGTAFKRVLPLLSRIGATDLVTDRYPLARIAEAFGHAAAGRGLKTAITPGTP